jgi:alcohol dehydrogenase
MNDFEFYTPTRILFGRDAIEKTGSAVQACGARKVLLHYGGSSVIKYGVLERVKESLRAAGVEFIELGGVQPNPRLSLVYEGIELCRREGVDFLLPVGGGSAIDSAKAIAVGVVSPEDVWIYFSRTKPVPAALPVGVVLTIPAAGSEASNSCVITREELNLKRDFDSDVVRPRFAVMNPEVTFTLPVSQTLYGVSDIMSHILERYFTNVEYADLTDRLCEAAMKALIRSLPIVLEDPCNYEARAEIMWTGTLAHNGLLSTGRSGDWASHMIEHELSGEYDVAHGAGLSVIFPAWMKFVYKQRLPQFIKFAMRVWNVDYDYNTPERTAREGIQRFEQFYRQSCMPVRLGELGIGTDRFELMANRIIYYDQGRIGGFVKLCKEDVLAILNLAE